MATKNLRVVGYLPASDHQKLRDYMNELELSESAAIVQIIQAFFNDATPNNNSAMESLRAEVALLQQRLSIVEAAVASGTLGHTSQRHKPERARALPQLLPQTQAGLAKRLGVQPDSIAQALEKGQDYFSTWSKERDPASKAWRQQGDLFHLDSP